MCPSTNWLVASGEVADLIRAMDWSATPLEPRDTWPQSLRTVVDLVLASHNVLHVVYTWKEYDGSDWTIERSSERFITASPTTFSITTAGSKVPRTEDPSWK